MILFSTTGTVAQVVLNDLNGRTFVHPTVDYQLDDDEFTREEIAGSEDLGAALDAGEATVKDDQGNVVTTAAGLAALSVDHTIEAHTNIPDPTAAGEVLTVVDPVAKTYTFALPSVPGDETEAVSAADGTGGTVLTPTGTWFPVPLNAQNKAPTPGFIHVAPNAEVEVVGDKTAVVTGDVSVDNASGTRTQSEMRLVIDKGSGFTEVVGTRRPIYNRNAAQGGDSGTFTVVLDLEDGDVLRLEARRENGGGAVSLRADGSALSIYTQRGPKGEQGDAGAPGAGSTINVRDGGVLVPNSPFDTINVGPGLTAVDEGGGQVGIFLSGGGPVNLEEDDRDVASAPQTTTSTSGIPADTFTPAGGPFTDRYRLGIQFDLGNSTKDKASFVDLFRTDGGDVLLGRLYVPGSGVDGGYTAKYVMDFDDYTGENPSFRLNFGANEETALIRSISWEWRRKADD